MENKELGQKNRSRNCLVQLWNIKKHTILDRMTKYGHHKFWWMNINIDFLEKVKKFRWKVGKWQREQITILDWMTTTNSRFRRFLCSYKLCLKYAPVWTWNTIHKYAYATTCPMYCNLNILVGLHLIIVSFLWLFSALAANPSFTAITKSFSSKAQSDPKYVSRCLI